MSEAPKKKNVNRLNRIFRTSKDKLVLRSWHPTASSESQKLEDSFGITSLALKRLTETLTQSEKDKALRFEDPFLATEEAMARRQEKFGTVQKVDEKTNTKDGVQSGGGNGSVDEDLRRRMARFGGPQEATPTAAPNSTGSNTTEAVQKRMARFSNSTSSAGGTSALERREDRFKNQ